MEKYILIFGAIILHHRCFGFVGDLDYDAKLNIMVDHTFDDRDTSSFIRRGEIFAKSIHSDSISFKQVELTEKNINALRALAEKNGNYRIRALVKMSDGKEYLFFTFVKACALIESHLSDVFFINLDSLGNMIAITSAAPAICSGTMVENKNLVKFNTSVYIRHIDLGPVPDTATYIQKLEKEREAKERGEGRDNRSFLSKYWMYIVPLVILFLLPNASNNDSGGNAQR